ncbi:MAG: ATP-binding protein [Simkaniaceae bacterium]|nr:ATP-binding protein [Simkaniaceae bacterium]
MKITKEELISIIAQFNPWWRGEKIPDLPRWNRGAFSELMRWIKKPPAQRAVLLSGARQVGKTTLLLQAIQSLLDSGVPAGSILYATFDHPICRLAGLDAVLEAWRELEPKGSGPEYLFLDEAQFIKDIGIWVKHRVDFTKSQRIVFTGSATPLIQKDQESGVGRWHSIQISTLSFYEYLQIKNVELPQIHEIESLASLLNLSPSEHYKIVQSCSYLIGHFHEYLIRGGFPQAALVNSVTQAQRLLREDIVDKVLKRDMTALFGVRRILELEQMFIFLCMQDGGMQDTQTISKDLGIAKQTVQNFVDLFESTHLVYRLLPFGYGKEVLRGKNKLYLSDPAIAPAVLIKGKTILENPIALSQCVETAVIGHLWSHCRINQARFSYWRSPKEAKEVDLVIELDGAILPLEIKYQAQSVQARDVPGLIELVRKKELITRGYIATKTPSDLGLIPVDFQENKPIMKIPACLLCFYLGQAEFHQRNILNG